MSHAQKRAAPRQRATLSHNIPMKHASLTQTNSAVPAFREERIDPVAWLAARANVATATARVFAEINGFAGCR